MLLVDIGKTIKQARKEQKLSQQQLAGQARISRYTLSKIENGQVADAQYLILSRILAELGLEFKICSRPVSGLPVFGD